MESLGQERPAPVAMVPASGQSSDSRTSWDMRLGLVVVPLVMFVIAAFVPILDNGFVTSWDDGENFVDNPHFRGLGAAQVTWAWTTFWVGVYQPMAWLLFETQFYFGRLDPRAYHLTSLLLQIANAVVLYSLTIALLFRCRTDSRLESPWIRSVSAGLATALFAVHPLRVEAVAWASCQPYLPCILFAMLSVLAYLRAFPVNSSPRRVWLAGSFLLFVTALLFKAVAVSLPAVLLILDVYPLRRLPDGTGRWFGEKGRRAVWEKIPFALTSVLFMGLAIAAKPQTRIPVQHYDAGDGIGVACYAIWFYIKKMALPWNTIAAYPFPAEPNWLAPLYSLSILMTLAMSAGLFFMRRRWPGLLAAWLIYLVILAPNSGIIRFSEQIAADRYSYMATLAFVMLAAAGFCWLCRMSSRWPPAVVTGIVAISLGALLSLTAMTREECRTWLDSETLWLHTLTHGGERSFVARNNLGEALRAKGNLTAAEAHYVEALRLYPGYVPSLNNLGLVLQSKGSNDAAKAHFSEVIRLSPGYFRAHFNLGNLDFAQGMYEAAQVHFAEALRLNPNFANAHYNLGVVLYSLGDYSAARGHFAEAARLHPGDPDAYSASAMLMAACPEAKFRDGKEAVRFATRACELTEWKNPSCLNTLAAAQAEAGDFDAAVKWQERAIELLAGDRQQDEHRIRLVLYRAKKPYRQVSERRAQAGASL